MASAGWGTAFAAKKARFLILEPRGFVRHFLLLLAVLVAGCSPSVGENLGPKTLTAELDVEPMSPKVGTSMSIRLTITHTGGGTTSFSVLRDGTSFRPFVQTQAGAAVWAGYADQPTSGPRDEIVLTNGQSYVATLVWPLIDSSGNPLPPGTYLLTSLLDALGLAPGFTEITASVSIIP